LTGGKLAGWLAGLMGASLPACLPCLIGMVKYKHGGLWLAGCY